MIESKIINGHPWSIGYGDPDPSKRGEDAALMADLPTVVPVTINITIVSNPEDSHYEPDEEKRLTAARKLKVKELCMRCRHELCIRRKEYIN